LPPLNRRRSYAYVAIDKKGKPHDKPSGDHPFDRICAQRAITHRLTQPFRPQTNGMVARLTEARRNRSLETRLFAGRTS
jgi:transposase InsO family protein